MGEMFVPEELINDDVIECLVKKANGNISFVISCINEIMNYRNFTKQAITDNQLDRIMEEKSNSIKTLEKMSRPRKLYL